jgi:streptomycin 6-kinase
MRKGDDGIDRSLAPQLDDHVRRRLTLRFGADAEPWLDRLPGVLAALAERWHIEWGSLISRGSMAAVFHCRTSDGRPAVLKVSPDHARIAIEAAALQKWTTFHTPTVYALDETVGALLIEAIEPGIALDESAAYPTVESFADLLTSMHSAGPANPSFQSVARRVAYLFDAGTVLYRRHPRLVGLIPPRLYERGRRLATTLAEHAPAPVLLHGDLTPANIVHGGKRRGLVAIDPAPCIGDPGFDAVDLLFWQADSVATITARATELATATGVEADRLLDWCMAFAAMSALELAGSTDASEERLHPYLSLAVRARS